MPYYEWCFTYQVGLCLFWRFGMEELFSFFKARASKEADQVQIWPVFRIYNCFDRFVIGITAYAKSVNEIPKLERSRALACL